jgi:hypothetical protein
MFMNIHLTLVVPVQLARQHPLPALVIFILDMELDVREGMAKGKRGMAKATTKLWRWKMHSGSILSLKWVTENERG